MILDTIDRSIIKLLQNNGRTSISDLGKKVNMTPSGIRKRILKLEERGVITGYSVLINYAEIGKPVLAIVTVAAEPESIFDLITQFKCMNFIHEIYRLTQNNCLMLKFRAHNISDMRKMIDNTIMRIKGVNHVNIEIVLDIIKEKV